MCRRVSVALVALAAFVSACEQSDEELCEDAQKKLVECGSNAITCPDDLHDSVREQYECVVDADDCAAIGKCAR
jgi:hypothetical protein